MTSKPLCIFVSSFPMSTGTLKEINDPVQGQTQLVSESVRNDVDQDVFLMFNVVDENLSWYLEDNIRDCADPAGINQEDEDFIESNLMHGEKFVLYEAHSLCLQAERLLVILNNVCQGELRAAFVLSSNLAVFFSA